MLKKGLTVLAVLAVFGSASRAQNAGNVVNNVAQTIGATNLKSLQYSATGITASLGQSYRPFEEGPQFKATYSRSVDFEKGVSRQELVRTQLLDPPRGAGGQPLYTESRAGGVQSEEAGFNANSLALTIPHGWVKAAMTANPTAQSLTIGRRPMTMVSYTAKGMYKVRGYINSENLLEKVETWLPNEVLGDILVETSFSDYRDFAGVKFPTKIVQKQGGLPSFEYNVSNVQPNAAVTLEAPAPRPPAAQKVEPLKFAEGIWYLSGGGVNSALVEFKDFAVVVETGQDQSRALANIAQVKRMVPNKRIVQINSHHHSDHVSGLRDWISEGATIYTHAMNREYYDLLLRNPWTLHPDAYARTPKEGKFVYVRDKEVLTDGDRTMEIHWIRGNLHASNLLMSYLPKEKLLIVTDIFNMFYVPRPNDPPDGYSTPYTMNLWENIQRLKLDIAHIFPAHGREVVPFAELRQKIEGRPSINPPVR
ncbi:MAG: hypothetical protein A3H28_00015 [Acidobacteria bacterium RIFCSPLOWO2_02_FULL_61_28]|nr:MAG: hypothetical protein A3H28_00015 [Acidobacteria bacterium RIFCSPLOWO2_02_FULL_61_28]